MGIVEWAVIVVSGSVFVYTVADFVSWYRRRRASERNFARRFGGSVDRMLNEAQVDREQLRRLRDTQEAGSMKAASQVSKQLQVPLGPAAEFVRRV
jgi:hypothetical protein